MTNYRADSSRAHQNLESLVARPLFWVMLIITIMAAVTWNSFRLHKMPDPLPNLGKVENFELLDQYGLPFGSSDLENKAWVANFISTRGPASCPESIAKMAEIQHRVRGLSTGFRLITFTVDPEFDIPEKLLAQAKEYRASPNLWRFLAGPIDPIKTVAASGLKTSMNKDASTEKLEGLFNGTYYVLVDRNMEIRAYFDLNDGDVVDQVVRTAGILANRGY